MSDVLPFLGPLIMISLIAVNIFRDWKFGKRIECVKETIEARASNKREKNV